MLVCQKLRCVGVLLGFRFSYNSSRFIERYLVRLDEPDKCVSTSATLRTVHIFSTDMITEDIGHVLNLWGRHVAA